MTTIIAIRATTNQGIVTAYTTLTNDHTACWLGDTVINTPNLQDGQRLGPHRHCDLTARIPHYLDAIDELTPPNTPVSILISSPAISGQICPGGRGSKQERVIMNRVMLAACLAGACHDLYAPVTMVSEGSAVGGVLEQHPRQSPVDGAKESHEMRSVRNLAWYGVCMAKYEQLMAEFPEGDE